jgi:outer membrane protein assembly factor BamB
MPLLALLLLASDPATSWPQWGGPNRDFQITSAKLADSWPAPGPKRLWKRSLGDGYSSVVTDGTTLYTLYKHGTDTVIIALEKSTGKTVWEKSFDSAPKKELKEEMDPSHGTAPSSTPIIVGDRLFAITYMGRLVALNRTTGDLLWSEELWRKHGGTLVDYGYSNSPIAYKDTIILPVGGAGHAMMAFRQKDGAVVWQNATSDNAMSSPVLIQVDGQPQIVTVMLKEVLAVSPDTGELLWRHPHSNNTDTNVSSPVWCQGNILLVSSAYNSGTRAIHLKQDNGKTVATELWYNGRVRVHHGNLLPIGDYVYVSSGDFGPAPLTAVKIATGEIVWQQRVFAKANFVRADGKVILLDEDGKIALVKLTPEGAKVMAESEQMTNPAWTPPTLSGTTLILRDRSSIEALDLGV